MNIFLTECIFISSTHVIFNFSIMSDMNTTTSKGNIIVNSSLETNVECILSESSKNVYNCLIQEIINHCVDRAKFIFKEN